MSWSKSFFIVPSTTLTTEQQVKNAVTLASELQSAPKHQVTAALAAAINLACDLNVPEGCRISVVLSGHEKEDSPSSALDALSVQAFVQKLP